MNKLTFWFTETKAWFTQNTNWKCWLFGHDFLLDVWMNCQCTRCGVQDYEAMYEPEAPALRTRLWRLQFIFSSGRLRTIRCSDCSKWEYFLGRKLGGHEDCVPF